ncbi:MAG: fructose-6-phosphate aldolase [Verrucomicrobiaceae bacterium]|nr:fructose-6-phosphate aldolase [Verrucomicrobiaceae bacterium]
MKLFIDTADVAQIKEAWSWGIVDGVTTNPTHVMKTGRKPGDVYREILEVVNGPVSLETIATDAPTIVKEGRALAKLGPNVVVKVPVIREGLMAVKELSADGIKTNVTLNFSPLQALLAAKCGATYISPFVGRLDFVGHVGMDLVRQIRTIYDNYDFKTQILTAAVRHPEHVLQAALAGSDVCTMFFDVLKLLYDHPLTDTGLDVFLKDWAKAVAQAQ